MGGHTTWHLGHPMLNPELRRRHKAIMREVLNRPNVQAKLSRIRTGRKLSAATRAMLLEYAKRPKSAEHRQRIAAANKGQKRPTTTGHRNPACRPEVLAKILAATQIKPNRLELHFTDFLNQHFPALFRYVGDGRLIIGYKCPDFVFQGGPLLIELWGSYWHRNDSKEKRAAIFKKYGYETEFIIDTEFLKTPTDVVDKIRRFIIKYGYGQCIKKRQLSLGL